MSGVSVERFWRLTPAELTLEIEGFRERRKHQEYLNGLLCMIMAEPYRDKDKHPKPFKPEDFMPSYEKPKAEEPKPKQTWQEMLALIRMSAGDSLVKKEV